VSTLLHLGEKLQIWQRQDHCILKVTYIMHVIHRICADVQHFSKNYYKTIGPISLTESYNLKPVLQKVGLYDFRSEFGIFLLWPSFVATYGFLRITLSL